MFFLLGSVADEESAKLFFMSKAGGGEREMRQLMAGEMSKDHLRERCFQCDVGCPPPNLQYYLFCWVDYRS